MQKTLLLLHIFLVTFCLQAQNFTFNTFDRLESVGEMPESFVQVLQKKENNSTKESNLLDDKFVFSVLMNGKVLYGDPVTQYLNLLLDKILENKSELRKEVQIFVLKSEQVNAFSTPKGTIFVNLGLIAHCSNEAELAFIICHELSHFTKAPLEKLIDSDRIKDIDDFLKYHSQSRELELVADKYGFLDFFKDLGYDISVFEDVFDMLQYSNLPFGEKKFTRNFFENEYYKFDDSYFLSQINPVTSRENYVDTLSSHPNILNRRLEMRKIVGQFSKANNSQRTAFFEKQFQETKMLAQFESINQMIIRNNYLLAYYNSCALQDTYPLHPFLQQTESAALYALSRLKATDNYKNNVSKASQIRGDIQFFAHVLEKMNKNELLIWTLRTLWNSLHTTPSNEYLTQIFNHTVRQVTATIGSLEKFCDFRMGDSLAILQNLDTTTSNKGRYDRYKEKVWVKPSLDFKVENYMLGDLKQNPDFLDAVALSILTAEKAEVNNLISKFQKKTKNKIPIVVFQPNIELKGASESEKRTQKQTSVLEKECEKLAHSCGFTAQIISGIEYNTTFSYPIYVRLLEFESNINRIIPLAYETRKSEELCKILGTSYFNFVTFSKTKAGLGKENIAYNFPLTGLAVFLYPAAPLAVLSWLPQKYNASFTFVMYDLRNKKYLHYTMRNITITDKSELFQTLYNNYSAARKNIKQ